MRVTYLGQACTLIEAAGRKILVDPWLTEGAYFGTWFHTHLLADAGVSLTSIPRDIDYLFLSHEHQDHADPETLRNINPDTPVLICKFPSDRFRKHLERLGFRNIRELPSGEEQDLGDGLRVTIIGTAEYTNDSAIVVAADGCRVFNETDCKLSFPDLTREAAKGIDLGFYMFSGANWYPMLYDYDEPTMRQLIGRRRTGLLKGFVARVRATKPKVVVPGAGPCTVLDPAQLALNSEEHGIFVDPAVAVAAIERAALAAQPLYMAVSDVWDSARGFESHALDLVRRPRTDYLREASARVADDITRRRDAETPAGSDFANRFATYFNERVAAQTETIRRRIGAKLGFCIAGPQGGDFTVDFTAPDGEYVRAGLAPDWTYRIATEDKLRYPFLTGQMEFLEDLFLSLRVRLSRRPDQYNEPLYHFLYDPDPARLHDWYEKH